MVYDGFGRPPEVATVPDPSPPSHGVVVRVEATGLCRSDWHGWMGHDPDIRAFPHVPGHELAGVIEAVGPDVREWAPGARVTVPFVCACGGCEQCRAGNEQICDRQRQPGFTHWGSYAELVALDWADVNLVALPGGRRTRSRRPGSAAASPPPTARSCRSGACSRASGWRCTGAAASGCRR